MIEDHFIELADGRGQLLESLKRRLFKFLGNMPELSIQWLVPVEHQELAAGNLVQ